MTTQGPYKTQAAQTTREEIEQVAAAYRVWGQKRDRVRLEQLRTVAWPTQEAEVYRPKGELQWGRLATTGYRLMLALRLAH